METRGRRRPTEEGESYFMSMTDMMVGLLLIFIILLAYFALQLQTKTAELTGASAARKEMLEDMQQDLEDQGLKVAIDTRSGVLRLPDDVLFAKGSSTLSGQGIEAVSKVAEAMVNVMPRYSYTTTECDKLLRVSSLEGSNKPSIDAVFVEGHTDSDRIGGPDGNYNLSVQRALETFKALRAAQSGLDNFVNKCGGERILGLSGYGPDRPVDKRDTEEGKSKNRRIDLRFLMNTPTTDADRDLLEEDK